MFSSKLKNLCIIWDRDFKYSTSNFYISSLRYTSRQLLPLLAIPVLILLARDNIHTVHFYPLSPPPQQLFISFRKRSSKLGGIGPGKRHWLPILASLAPSPPCSQCSHSHSCSAPIHLPFLVSGTCERSGGTFHPISSIFTTSPVTTAR